MMVIGFSSDACFRVAELMLMDVCVGTTLPYLNCRQRGTGKRGLRSSIELFFLIYLDRLGRWQHQMTVENERIGNMSTEQ
jgi:hypothetical protein